MKSAIVMMKKSQIQAAFRKWNMCLCGALCRRGIRARPFLDSFIKFFLDTQFIHSSVGADKKS